MTTDTKTKTLVEEMLDAYWNDDPSTFSSHGCMQAAARVMLERMRIASRQMTVEAEKMGAGEAWAEDCWYEMVNAFAREP